MCGLSSRPPTRAQNWSYGASPRVSRSWSASVVSSGHAAAGASVVRMAVAGTVVGNEKLAHVSVECLKRHPRWREEVRADGCKAPRRGGERPACEPGEDPLLGVVERFVGHFLFQLAVHGTDVDAQLVRAVRARVRGEVACRGHLRHEVRNVEVKVLAK